jgi:hypothetical protein
MGRGWGFGRGRGWGRGWSGGFGRMGYPGVMAYPDWTGQEYAPDAWTPPSQTQELEMLRAEAKQMEGALQAIHKRIDDLAAGMGEPQR